MIKFIKTSFSLTNNIKTTGAITETSIFVAREITKHINPDRPQLILEVGAGYGNVTREILKKMHPDSKLFSVELNTKFCLKIEETINDPRLTVINDSAENFETYLPKQKIDAIISTLPFTFFSTQLAQSILSKFKNHLSTDGEFSQVYYSLRFLKQVKRYFSVNKVKITVNFPLGFIIHSSNKKE